MHLDDLKSLRSEFLHDEVNSRYEDRSTLDVVDTTAPEAIFA